MNGLKIIRESRLKRKLQVFISSTYIDLIEERQAAVSAILKAGHIPAGMELFTAGDRSQMKTIERWIDESDVYMLILGGRYGSFEKVSGISYTELEYDYACQQGKPVFAVVINEKALESKVQSGGTQFIEKSNPKELELFKAKVLSNISSFFDDHKDIKLCVHESLADFATNRDLKGWVSGGEIIDTKPLLDEIKNLNEENQLLKIKLDEFVKLDISTKSNTVTNVEKFEELEKILKSIQIKIPDDLSGEKDISQNLLDLFYNNKDVLITGVTSRSTASEVESFFFHNISPKLQVHGLTFNEKIAGVQYRRTCTTKVGNDFLAYLDKKKLPINMVTTGSPEITLPNQKAKKTK